MSMMSTAEMRRVQMTTERHGVKKKRELHRISWESARRLIQFLAGMRTTQTDMDEIEPIMSIGDD